MRKVWGFELAVQRTYHIEGEDVEKKGVYLNLILEGQPRLCKQCTDEALADLQNCMMKFLTRKLIDEKTQIYTL
jgi:hypothetical protein